MQYVIAAYFCAFIILSSFFLYILISYFKVRGVYNRLGKKA